MDTPARDFSKPPSINALIVLLNDEERDAYNKQKNQNDSWSKISSSNNII